MDKYNINVWDTECYKDDKNIYIPYCVSIIIYDIMTTFYGRNCIIAALKYIYENIINNNIIIYIHNINFDGMIILDIISYYNNIYMVDILLYKYNIYYIKIIYKNKYITFRCSYKLISQSLNNIANSLNIENKLYFPYNAINKYNIYKIIEVNKFSFNDINDYNMWYKNNKSNIFNVKNESIKYCEQDVIILHKILYIMIKTIYEVIKINILKSHIYTSSSLSVNSYKKLYNKNNKLSLKLNHDISNLIRDSYYGGRCEVFGNIYKNEKILYYDFPGMYGLCMLENYPYGKYDVIYDQKLHKNSFMNISYISDINIPILPHHNIYTKKLLFTNGELNGTYWYEEIELFIKEGGIITKIHYSIVFEKSDKLFLEFINNFNKLRSRGGIYKILGKNIINGLYGKLGMNIKKEKTLIAHNNIQLNNILDKYVVNSIKSLNNIYLVQINKNNKTYTKNTNIAIASAITSKARIKLYKSFNTVKKNKGRVLYCDTDSIFAAFNKNKIKYIMNKQLDNHLIFNENNINNALFMLPKSYAIEYKNKNINIKLKGVNKKNILYNDIAKYFYNNIDMDIKNEFRMIRKDFKIKGEIYNKKISLYHYDKRKFINNKKNTLPYKYIYDKYI